MTTPSHTSCPVPSAEGEETAMADLVLAGRATASGPYLAGVIALAQLDTVGQPRKLARDLFPGTDPAVVQEIWDRALAVGVRAGQMMAAPRFNRDRLARLRGELEAAGFSAMGGLGGRMVTLAQEMPAREHPGDEEPAREHPEW